MTLRLFDLLIFFIGTAFIIQAIRTPQEQYDLMGPALWPLSVTILMQGLLILNALIFRTSQKNKPAPLSQRFWLICLVMACFVTLQYIDLVPFFLSAAALCFCGFLLLSEERTVKQLIVAGTASIMFCYSIQYLFTQIISLDLKTTF